MRSRFDALAYNNETIKAETSFEISAFDRDGKMIMRPTVTSKEAQYREHYLMWTGPFVTSKKINPGTGLLVDFTDVDGSKANYNQKEPASNLHAIKSANFHHFQSVTLPNSPTASAMSTKCALSSPSVWAR